MPDTTFMQEDSNGTPPDNIDTPVITYHIDNRIPHIEIKPRFRQGIINDEENQRVTVYGQSFDYTIEFTIWADTNEQADKTMNQFEDSIFTYTGDLMRNGVQKIIFRQQKPDNKTTTGRATLANRTLVYQVILERLFVRPVQMFKIIFVKVNGELVCKIQ
jgi:hypothetical protein